MRLLLIMNGSRERYAGGADEARRRVWSTHCSAGTTLEIGHLPSEVESGGIAKNYEFGRGNALSMASLYPERCAQAERDGFDAAIIHCCSDPGLEESRERVKIPVIGPGETTLRAGALLGRRIGMTVPSSESLEPHRHQVRRLGLEDRLVGFAPVDKPLGKYADQDPAAMTESWLAAARTLVEQGADVICPSGLAYIPVRVSAAEVSRRLGVPVVDPALVSLRTAEMLVAAAQPARQAVAALA